MSPSRPSPLLPWPRRPSSLPLGHRPTSPLQFSIGFTTINVNVDQELHCFDPKCRYSNPFLLGFPSCELLGLVSPGVYGLAAAACGLSSEAAMRCLDYFHESYSVGSDCGGMEWSSAGSRSRRFGDPQGKDRDPVGTLAVYYHNSDNLAQGSHRQATGKPPVSHR